MERVHPLTPELEALVDEHRDAFGRRFGPRSGTGKEHLRLYFSPGRVNLMGAHLDYNGGPVLPTAIDRGTLVALRSRSDRRVHMASTLDASRFEFDLDDLPGERLGKWVDYPLGVLLDLFQAARERGTAGGLRGMELLFGGNLPIGAGLSSSASICVGTALALDRAWGLGLEMMDRVASALRAERTFVGVHCGIMDPYAVGLARPDHLLWLDCKDASHEHLPIDFEQWAIGVADTGVRRELAQSEFNRRVEQARRAFEGLAVHAPHATCLRDVTPAELQEHGRRLPEVERRRARHVIGEVVRTFEARRALLQGEVEEVGRLMLETHRSLRDLYEVSCPELDCIVETAGTTDGVAGARLTGAGFGGCVVMLMRRGAEEQVRQAVQRDFESRFGRRPTVEVFGGDAGPREL
jgi:galactokinase